MPQLLDSISTIISVFYKHGKKDEDCSTISKREVKRFIQREFDNITVNPYDAHTIEAVLQLLDRDGDGAVDFNEFLLLVFRVAKVNLNHEGMKGGAMKHVSLNLGRKRDATLSHVSLSHEGMRGVTVSHLSSHGNLSHKGMRGPAMKHMSLKKERKRDAADNHVGLNNNRMRGVATERKDLNVERKREATVGHVNLNHKGMSGATMRDVTLKQGR
ncbi:unnamed protein product [Caretta caretta]